ncbi:MAG: hypothetical protein WBN66_00005 [Smithella sp.]
MLVIIPANGFCDHSFESSSQVWKVGKRQWTIQEENRYSRWVADNITEDFFLRYNIPVDCADVVYGIRWIYARMAHLPAAATTVDGQLIGHWSKNWKHLPTHRKWYKDRRFRTALLFMLSKTSTKTLPMDTYPIHIATDSVNSGTVFFIAESHAGIVRSVILDGSTAHPVQTLEAIMPPRIQKLNHKNFISTHPESLFQSGLVKFRWLERKNDRWQYLSVHDHPYYSEEQYSSTFNEGYVDYIESVAKRIDPKIYDPRDKINRLLDVFIRQLKDRIPVVLKGREQCYEKRCPEGSPLWELYSTPGRDEYIYVMISHIKEIIKKNNLIHENVLGKMAGVRLQIAPHRVVTAEQVFQNAVWMSSDPEDTIANRWGLDKCSIIERRIKKAQDTIAFIKETYDTINPRLAERLITVRQTIVNDMTEEKKKSNCTDIELQH